MRSKKRKLLRIALGLGAFLLVAAPAPRSAAQELSMALRTYSALNFVKDEGEWCCLAVTLVPYSKPRESAGSYPTTGVKVLWRGAGPWVDPPLLFDAVSDGKFLLVQLPSEIGGGGTWKLQEKGNMLMVYSPGGNVEKLKRKR